MRHILVSGFLIAITLAVYHPARNYGFINYDDPMYVTNNPVVQAGLSPNSVMQAFTDRSISLWTPLTILSYQLEVEVFGVSAPVMHRTNIALHALNAILLYLLLFRLTTRPWPSLFVAALFAVHPTHVESVAWITERKDVLSTAFWLLTCHSWLKYVRSNSARAYAASMVLFILALLSKPMVVTLPIALIILDFWPLNRLRSVSDLGPLIKEKLPLLLLSCASAVQTIVTQPPGGPESQVNVIERLVNPLVAYVDYLNITFIPTRLAAVYPQPLDGYSIAYVLSCAAALAMLTIVALTLSCRAPYLAAGWAWFILTMGPVSGVIPLRSVLVADRFTYIPTIGLFIAVVWSAYHIVQAAHRLPQRWLAPTTVVVGGLLVAVLGALAASQVRLWKDTETLFRDAVRKTGPNVVAYTQLAATFLEESRLDEAKTYAQAALDLYPKFTVANDIMAELHIAENSFAAAIPFLEEASRNQKRRPSVLQRLGAAHHALGNLESAEKHYRASIRASEESGRLSEEAVTGLIQVLIATDRLDEAETVVLANLQNLPESGYFYFLAGNVAGAQGRDSLAAARFQAAIRLDPDLKFAWLNLGNLVARRGDLPRAIECFKRAVEIDPDYLLAHRNLAHAFSELGDVDQARRHRAAAEALAGRVP